MYDPPLMPHVRSPGCQCAREQGPVMELVNGCASANVASHNGAPDLPESDTPLTLHICAGTPHAPHRRLPPLQLHQPRPLGTSPPHCKPHLHKPLGTGIS